MGREEASDIYIKPCFISNYIILEFRSIHIKLYLILPVYNLFLKVSSENDLSPLLSLPTTGYTSNQ